MTDLAAIAEDRRFMDQGTACFLEQVGRLDSTSLLESSPLPGWTRGHIVTHVARNADGVTRLLGWARTGVEDPMYGDRHPRNEDIAAGAGRPLGDQVADLRQACRRLDAALDAMPDAAWSATISAATRQISAGYLPWMRAREVWLHALDLDLGATYRDLPPEFARRFLGEVIQDLSGRPGMPALELHTQDGTLTVAGEGAPVPLEGTAAALLCRLTGRPGEVSVAGGGELPALPDWL
ncbi:MAG: maleylpyruvate isomerase family mycothiol-dependent enzyme [Candidatus Dormibacteraceae bacterium]